MHLSRWTKEKAYYQEDRPCRYRWDRKRDRPEEKKNRLRRKLSPWKARGGLSGKKSMKNKSSTHEGVVLLRAKGVC